MSKCFRPGTASSLLKKTANGTAARATYPGYRTPDSGVVGPRAATFSVVFLEAVFFGRPVAAPPVRFSLAFLRGAAERSSLRSPFPVRETLACVPFSTKAQPDGCSSFLRPWMGLGIGEA